MFFSSAFCLSSKEKSKSFKFISKVAMMQHLLRVPHRASFGADKTQRVTDLRAGTPAQLKSGMGKTCLALISDTEAFRAAA